MKLSSNQRNLAITVLLCGGAVAYVFALFLPTQRTIADLQSELADHQDTVGRAQTLDTSLAMLDSELSATLAYAQRWRDDAPSVHGRASALGAVNRCATEAGVMTLQFDPQPTEPLATVAKFPVSLTCRGTFAQVVNLLQRLEALPATIWMDEIRIHVPGQEAGGQPGESPIVQCDLSLVVFADNHDSSS